MVAKVIGICLGDEEGRVLGWVRLEDCNVVTTVSAEGRATVVVTLPHPAPYRAVVDRMEREAGAKG